MSRIPRQWLTCSPQEELDNASEGLEKYVMTKIYPKAFMPNEADKYLNDKMRRLQFLTPRHLDVGGTYVKDNHFNLAQKGTAESNAASC